MESLPIPWLAPLAESWREAAVRGRPPHAVLLTGRRGVGKRAAAGWMAMQRLGRAEGAAVPEYRRGEPADGVALPASRGHADLHRVSPPEDKHSIQVDQIRDLVGELGLTSYEGGVKVVIIEPANAMTASAANSLLKTLEEPPGDSLLLLVADRTGTLPATIVSRCQRIAIATPPERVSLEWLNRLEPASNWLAALRMAGHAPLAAIVARERLDLTDAMARDFAQVGAGRASAIDVAARWAQYEPQFVLGWIDRQVRASIHRLSGTAAAAGEDDARDSVPDRIDRRNLFCYLDVINRVRSQSAGSFNVQLTLESLLIDWAEGLVDCGKRFIRGGLLPIPDGKVNT